MAFGRREEARRSKFEVRETVSVTQKIKKNKSPVKIYNMTGSEDGKNEREKKPRRHVKRRTVDMRCVSTNNEE